MNDNFSVIKKVHSGFGEIGSEDRWIISISLLNAKLIKIFLRFSLRTVRS